jgi:hypothetical protein
MNSDFEELMDEVTNSPNYHRFTAQHRDDETDEESEEVDRQRLEQFTQWCQCNRRKDCS